MIPFYVVYVCDGSVANKHVPLELLDTRRDSVLSYCPYKHVGILFNGISDRVNLQLLCNLLTESARVKPRFIVVTTRHPIEEWQPHDNTYRAEVASYKSILRTNARKATWASVIATVDEQRGVHDRNFRAAFDLIRATN